MLDKRLKIGGLQVGGPRTAQNPARFRVANNVYQTRDEYMVPRFHNEEELAIGSGKEVFSLSSYRKTPFAVVRDSATSKMEFYANSTAKVATYGIAASDFSAPGEGDSSGPQYVEKFGCLFVHFPYYGLYKYDGYQAYKAGVPLPYFTSAQKNNAGTAYVRVIQHHLDFQGNIVNSGYVEFRANPAANIVNIQTDKGAVDIVTFSGVGIQSPTIRTSKLDGTYDEHFWVATGLGVTDTGARTVNIPTGGDHSVVVGAYVIVSTTTRVVSADIPVNCKAIAVKVVGFDATSVTVSLDNALFLDASGAWSVDAFPTLTGFFDGTFRPGTNHYFSVWTSNVATGNYVLRMIGPVYYQSAVTHTFAVDCTSLVVPDATALDNPFNLSGNLGDIYDVTTVKDIFPYFSPYNSVNLPKAFTTYGELALVADSSILYFNDTSLGGSFEMVNGLSFAVVGEGTDGDIQSICGNFEFVLVSRQSKNYYVSGNLPTANYRVQPITGTSMGAHSNESSISYEDKILFLNAQGVWALYSGARCEEISININGLFKNFSNTTEFAEETFFDMSDYVDFVSFGNYPGQWVRARSDVARGLVTFLIKGDGTGTALVLNMNNGEFYTWNGFSEGHGFVTPKVNDLMFINGEYFIALNYETGGNYHGNVYSELKTGTSKYDYVPSDYPIRLDTTWFNAGEPSLEKKLQQLKMWGILSDGEVNISHFLDYNNSEIDDGTYDNGGYFSHKHRLTPANFLAASVSLDIVPGRTGRFELEGMEIEFEPFQTGMKR